jgi:hypothetical protein
MTRANVERPAALFQNALGMPACFRTPLAVWRERIFESTGK